MDAFTKVVRLGTQQNWSPGGRWYSVFAKVEWDGKRLSITGVEGPLASGNCLGAAGQIAMSADAADIRPAPGWSRATIRDFFAAWRRWHLNDMHAECEHQRAAGMTWQTHPLAKCPECGYKLGTAWLTEDVPEEVLTYFRDLPDADKVPAWL